MTLQSSGPIDFEQINVELGLPANTQISLNDTNIRSLSGISTGAIGMNNFYNTTKPFTSWVTKAATATYPVTKLIVFNSQTFLKYIY